MNAAATLAANSASGVAASSSSASRGLSGMKSEDFFKLLVNEMQHQDPFEPTKTGDMISQMSQLRNIEMSSQFTQAMQTLTSSQRTIGTSELLGKFITAQVDSGASDGAKVTVGGVVTGIRYNDDGTAMLELDTGDVIRAMDVQRVMSVEEAERQITSGQLLAPTGPIGQSSVAASQSVVPGASAQSKSIAGSSPGQTAKNAASAQPLNALGRPSWLNLALNL
ncbi:MAG: hypothetical protein JNG88_12550 [Phycisphaerales bacterium]|nr:hypothetical protein [Phycisphaerales bacterium]